MPVDAPALRLASSPAVTPPSPHKDERRSGGASARRWLLSERMSIGSRVATANTCRRHVRPSSAVSSSEHVFAAYDLGDPLTVDSHILSECTTQGGSPTCAAHDLHSGNRPNGALLHD